MTNRRLLLTRRANDWEQIAIRLEKLAAQTEEPSATAHAVMAKNARAMERRLRNECQEEEIWDKIPPLLHGC